MFYEYEYTIQQKDVGRFQTEPVFTAKKTCACCGETKLITLTLPSAGLGKVEQADVGRKLHYINGAWHVEPFVAWQSRIKAQPQTQTT